MGYLLLGTCGYSVGNKAFGGMVELNAEGGELLAKPASSWNVLSSLGHNTNELSPTHVNTKLHEADISNHEAS